MQAKNVFPTHVGMNRRFIRNGVNSIRIPHTRGDEPYKNAQMGTAQISIPHTRGDEPHKKASSQRRYQYSPHTWG